MITEATLLEMLRAGTERTRAFIARLTDYHGGPAETEYLLTVDIAREFLDRNREVGVEGLNRSFCTALTSLNSKQAYKTLKGKRTDVVVGQLLNPEVLIEVKIRISRYAGIAGDLRKLRDTIDFMKPAYQRGILGASLFQMHIKPTRARWRHAHFVLAVGEFEKRLRNDLHAHAHIYPNFILTLHDLMASPTDGIVDQAIEEDGDGTPMLGEKGHATRYYAIIIKHRLYGSKPASTFQEMKAEAGR
jgi:hypothetical protein